MSFWLTALADVVRAAGLATVEEPGWRTRGHGGLAVPAPAAIVLHHTAGPPTGDAPSLGVVRDGRPGLPGPLAQLVLARSGRVHVVAAGLCWHAGATWETWQSNAYSIGIEAEATGRAPWPPVQYDAYVRLARALADHYGVPYARVLGHKEVARPAGRKTDPNFDVAAFRAALRVEEPVPDWSTPIRNFNGDTVAAQQILVATEARVADVQRRLDVVTAELAATRRLVEQLLARTAP